MITKCVCGTLVVIALTMCAVAQNPPGISQPTAAQSPTVATIGLAKIAFMSVQQAIAFCDEGKREAAILDQYVSAKSAELQKLQKEVEALKTQLEVQESKLTDEARMDLADQIEAKNTNAQRFQQDTQKDIDKRRQKLQDRIARKMLPVIEKIAKDKGVSVIQFLDVAQIFGYVDPSLVVTDDVVKAYNLTYPAAAAAPAAKK
jgi:Skp family chaperone for outer membrane proteins